MISVGLDIGNSKISCIVCDISTKANIKILSFVTRPTNNIKKSVITDISKVKNEIRDIISQVSKESQTEIVNINSESRPQADYFLFRIFVGNASNIVQNMKNQEHIIIRKTKTKQMILIVVHCFYFISYFYMLLRVFIYKSIVTH